MTPPNPPNAAVWAALRSWVDSHEAQELADGASAITTTQVEIISRLIAVEEKPLVDGGNYIADLNHHAQRHSGFVDYSKEEHIPPGRNGGGGRWRVFCKLPWCDQVFPQAGYGFAEGQEPPSFPSKKVAKQFAAKMAMEYVRKEAASKDPALTSGTATASHIARTDDGGVELFPPSKKAKRALPSTDVNAIGTSHGPRTDTALSESVNVSTHALGGSESSGNKATQKAISDLHVLIRQLAIRLNYKVPTYNVSPEPERPGFFKGEAMWLKEPLAPEQPIRVQGVFGDAQAKEQLAAKVYEWLGKQGDKRESDLAAIMLGITQVKES